MIDLSQCQLPPYAHQVTGIEKLIADPYVLLADEMGVGKGLQVIVAAQLLFQQGIIDRMIVVAPACVKSVWLDEDLGELKKHLFTDTPVIVTEFHTRVKSWQQGPPADRIFKIWITNYEFLAAKARLTRMLLACGEKTFLVLDESSYVKSYSAQRTKACLQLRRRCGRVVLLNGTPIANSPLDLYSQSNILHPSILNCPTVIHFRGRYEIQARRPFGPNGSLVPVNIGWTNLDDLSNRLAPYTLRRMKKDVLANLPEKLPPVTVTVTLTPTTWKHYRDMREDLVIWLQSDHVVTASTAAIKIMRLAQIVSGFVGGVEEANIGEEAPCESDDLFGVDSAGIVMIVEPPSVGIASGGNGDAVAVASPAISGAGNVIEVGREKLDAFHEWLALRLDEDPNLKLLVQCRFRAEIARLTKELRERHPSMDVGEIVGGQKKQHRQEALRLMDPRTAPAGPVVVTMSSAGSLGLNLTASHTVVRLSRDYSLWLWLQSEDRVHRPGQTSAISYTDFVARGPKGQKTVDHVILEALMTKQDIAQRTAANWIKALTEE